MARFRDRPVLAEPELRRGVDALAGRLRARMADGDWTLVTVLDGGMFFAADLARGLSPELRMDVLRIRSYGDATAPQHAPRVELHPERAEVAGRRILLVDDVLDTGRTLAEARRLLLEELGAQEVLCVVLVDKPARRAVDLVPDEHVLRLDEDLFLVGYGLDHAGHYRNLPEVRALLPVAPPVATPSAAPPSAARGGEPR